MLPLLIILLLLGLAGAYWFTHAQNTVVSGFWELAGLGVLMLFLLLGIGLLARLAAPARGGKR